MRAPYTAAPLRATTSTDRHRASLASTRRPAVARCCAPERGHQAAPAPTQRSHESDTSLPPVALTVGDALLVCVCFGFFHPTSYGQIRKSNTGYVRPGAGTHSDASITTDANRCPPVLLPSDVALSLRSCVSPRDCEIVLDQCCTPCAFEAIHYRAVSRRRASAYGRSVCPGRFVHGRDVGVACPACEGGLPENIAAVCIDRTCPLAAMPWPACS